MKTILTICALLALWGCNSRNYFEGPDGYIEDFESYRDIESMLEGNDERWSFIQSTLSRNTLALDTNIVHTGRYSLRSTADPSSQDVGASKSSIVKQKMAFWQGETVAIEFWVYLAGDDSAEWLFLFDLEEQASIGAGPGMRLALVDNALLVEHKYPNPNIGQFGEPKVEFPRDQWVKVRFEARLEQRKKGYVKVWQDDELIIEQQDWNTLPKDILYFQQGTKGMYSSIEFGITANTQDSPMTMYVDDISVGIIN